MEHEKKIRLGLVNIISEIQNKNYNNELEEIRLYAGTEMLLALLGKFPNNELDYQYIEEDNKFLWFRWTSVRKETYLELMDRKISEYLGSLDRIHERE